MAVMNVEAFSTVHSFRKFLDLPKDTSWQVVDVPAVCKKGRRRQRSGETSLQYFEDSEKANDGYFNGLPGS